MCKFDFDKAVFLPIDPCMVWDHFKMPVTSHSTPQPPIGMEWYTKGVPFLQIVRLRAELPCIYLLLAEFSVRTVNYGPSCFPSIYGPSAKRAGHKSMEKNEDP